MDEEQTIRDVNEEKAGNDGLPSDPADDTAADADAEGAMSPGGGDSGEGAGDIAPDSTTNS